jgi:hypothetical protein
VNAEASIQSLPRMRLSSFGRGFLCRALLVVIFVSLTHQFEWRGLRYLTSEAVLCLSRSVGLSVERVSADTIFVQGNLFRFVTSCTFVDVVMGAIPLVWAFNRSTAKNLLTVLPLTVGFFAFNLIRLEISQLLYARGVSWSLADDVLGGIAYFAVWVFIVSWFKKYWWQTLEFRPIKRVINKQKERVEPGHISSLSAPFWQVKRQS